MTGKRSNKRFILGIAVAFAVPLSFFLITKFLSKDKIVLPSYYHIERIDTHRTNGDTKYDTVYHQVSDLHLTNQLGREVALSDLPGKIVLVNFFFTKCPDVCPRLSANVVLLQKAFRRTAMKRNDTLVQFISVTVDPEHDSFPVLRSYAERYRADHDHWWFLTGDKKKIYDFARNELGLSTGPGDGGAEDFLHSQKLVLLDKERFIRGYYDGLDTAALAKCANDIGLLVLEKKRKKK